MHSKFLHLMNLACVDSVALEIPLVQFLSSSKNFHPPSVELNANFQMNFIRSNRNMKTYPILIYSMHVLQQAKVALSLQSYCQCMTEN